ncbi:MAG: valine--tRNA ligase [Sedimentisphaerales bacterium]|nr:valine--tRNA ligase [Sedimentisphaerales bacterium]
MSQELPKIYNPQEVQTAAAALWDKGKMFHVEHSTPEGARPYCIVIPPPNVTAPLHLGHALNNTLQDILIRRKRMQGFHTLWMPGTDHAGIATQTVVDKRLKAEGQPALADYKQMEAEGKGGREAFLAKVQAWKDEYEARIINQLQMMGCSCDWERTRFTMDEVCGRAVRTNFFNLFKDGLIYRGKRLVNWDPATQTVLADDEVEHETVQGHFWYMRYPLEQSVTVGGKTIEFVTVATTRPETMLGDTAVAINPNDPRAEALVGKMVRLPIVGRLIPIVADDHVVLPNPESEDEKARFSTGFLKVTPAHDPNDEEIGKRHNLPFITVMAPDGTISNKYDWTDWEEIRNPDVENVIGMDRFEAREAIVEWFRQENLLEEVRDYAHEVGHSYRSHVPIEYYRTDQWYIDVKKPIPGKNLEARSKKQEDINQNLEARSQKSEEFIPGTDISVNSLAGLALKPLLDGRVKFYPERYAKTYENWVANLRDWPISRQLWWGHRIPVWSGPVEKLFKNDKVKDFDKSKVNQFTSDTRVFTIPIKIESVLCAVQTRSSNEGTFAYVCVPEGHEEVETILENSGFLRDTDVLDTWFSSALWPFSTMGWPEEREELKTFYPGNVLCTAREIITLWVSRMVMMGQYCIGDIPFSDVFIHAMIQDGEGRKMSKSLGNGIDPLDIIDSHGADAMRFTLASMTTETQDVRMPVETMTLPDGRTANSSPKFDLGRNFCNKLWNASRFALMNLEGGADILSAQRNTGESRAGCPRHEDAGRMPAIQLEDRWILSRLAATIKLVDEQLDAYRFSEPMNTLYKFFWNELCDWYLELIKPRMRDEAAKGMAQAVLRYVMDATLRLMHPFMPFITEGIYQNLRQMKKVSGDTERMPELPDSEALTIARWPKATAAMEDSKAEKDMSLVQEVIRAIRDIRTRYQKPPRESLEASVKAPAQTAGVLDAQRHIIMDMCNLNAFAAGEGVTRPENAAVTVSGEMEICVQGVVDTAAERERLTKQKEQIAGWLKATQAKLANESFVSRAKPEVVQREREKLGQLQEQLTAVEKNLSELG